MKIKLLRWVIGLAKIIDGILILYTWGVYDPDFTSKLYEMIILELIKDYRKGK